MSKLMAEDRAQSFLQMIRRTQRGRHKIYLGYGPGVGKTFQMLSEGQRLKSDGIDVAVGMVETHGRSETAKLVDGLEVIARRKTEYRGIVVEEMDVDAILARKPQVALVDELAHTNAPDSRNAKRYQDVQELLAAGIHVISTLNVQHLESLYNTVENLLGVKVRERVPDSVVAEADEIVNIDLSAEDLQRRLREGKIYPKDRTDAALNNFFTLSNLHHLRELTLREIASQLDLKRRETRTLAQTQAAETASEQLMVCLSSRGPNSAHLLRYGSRLAGRLNRNWYAVYVQTPSEDPTVIDAVVQRLLADTLTLANQLGATVFTYKGEDVADTILRFAREYRVGNIIIGRPHEVPWWKRMLGRKSVATELVERSVGVTVIVVDAEQPAPTREAPASDHESAPAPSLPGAAATTTTTAADLKSISALLEQDRVVIWEDPVSRADIFAQMARAIMGRDSSAMRTVREKLEERERSGSTFLNEGIALPHARIEGLDHPEIAIGLTHAGVLDSPTETPIEIVFMLLSPVDGARSHLQLLARAARTFQDRDLRQRLRQAKSPVRARDEIRAWESAKDH